MSLDGFIPGLSRRRFLGTAAGGLAGFAAGGGLRSSAVRADLTPGVLPVEPLDIGDTPQFVFDLYAVDCTWNLREKQEPMKRVFHPGRKHGDAPLLTGDQPSHFGILRDEPNGPFRMWYQVNYKIPYPGGRLSGQPGYASYVGYAESSDGLQWDRPKLNLFPDSQDPNLPANCVLHRPEAPTTKFDAPQVVHVPERDRRGYRYHLLYLGGGPAKDYRGVRLVGSHDGIHWDLANDQLIAPIGSDHHNTIVYDPARDEYNLYLRAKHIYLAPGQSRDRLDSGQSRRGVALMKSKELWTAWESIPQTIIVPDESDAASGYNYFYGMPTRYDRGVFWGFLQSFHMNDYMHIELAWSRDGVRFERLPTRPKLIEYGPDGTWDDTMILGNSNWIEVGDEWWMYYNGWDGPHQTIDRTGGIGLAKFRKEGFISQRGPRDGGVVCTRTIRWPGGDLYVNADAHEGELRVRVSDVRRMPIEGFNYDDGPTFTGDAVRQEIRWNGKSLDEKKGEVVRLEFFLKDADLFTFCAGPKA